MQAAPSTPANRQASAWGTSARAGSVRRVPAADIEALVIRSVREHLEPSQEIDDRSLVNTHVARTSRSSRNNWSSSLPKHSEAIARRRDPTPSFRSLGRRQYQGGAVRFLMECRRNTPGRYVRKIAPPWSHRSPAGALWLDELIAEQTATTDSIAKRERCSVRKVNMTISLAFLAPDLRQGRHRRPAPAWDGSRPPRRLASRMVPPAPDARPNCAVAGHVRETRLWRGRAESARICGVLLRKPRS